MSHALPRPEVPPQAVRAVLAEQRDEREARRLDELAETVRSELRVPLALVSLVQTDRDRQVFPGCAGTLPGPYAASRSTPLTHSFCRYVVHDRRPLVISDARQDARLRANPAIRDLGVVAYAGFPLTDAGGVTRGSLCAIDNEPREWTPEELDVLEDLAARCETELRRESSPQPQAGASGSPLAREGAGPAQHVLGQRSRLLLHLSEALAETIDVTDVARAVTGAARDHLGCLRAGLWLRQTEIGRAEAGLPDGVSADPGLLCWVRHEDDGWHQAAAYARVPLDDTTPVGVSARRNETVVFGSRAEQNVRYPHLAHARQEGERRAFLPLISRGRLLGTLALVWPETGPVTDDQRLTISALSSYAAQAVERARLRQGRHDALVALQQSLMPRLPRTSELQLAARYLPASAEHQIGGDWFDARVVSPGCVEVMVGDVMGHDAAAAATMGQLRTMLRVLAATTDDGPAAQVTRLENAVEDLGVTGMASLVHGRLERLGDSASDAWEFVWTNAGHLPPLLVSPTGEMRQLLRRSDVFLGASRDSTRHEHREVLPAGSTLLLFTDGLVERRGEPLQTGLDRLRTSVGLHLAGDLEHLLDGVVEDQLRRRRDDDVAVLAVRLAPVG